MSQLLLAAMAAGAAPPMAEPGDLALGLKTIPADSRISAFEPLVVEVRFVNRADHDLRVDIGAGQSATAHLQVWTETGGVVAETPQCSAAEGGTRPLPVVLGVGDSVSQLWVVSGFYVLDTPGGYTLRMRLPSRADRSRILAESELPIRVEPSDAKRFDARCNELLRPVRQHRVDRLAPLDTGARVKAIYSVRHDIALPHTDWMSREWADRYACRAIKRIGSPRAEETYAALAARTDRVGEAARRLPTIGDVRMWDVICD